MHCANTTSLQIFRVTLEPTKKKKILMKCIIFQVLPRQTKYIHKTHPTTIIYQKELSQIDRTEFACASRYHFYSSFKWCVFSITWSLVNTSTYLVCLLTNNTPYSLQKKLEIWRIITAINTKGQHFLNVIKILFHININMKIQEFL